MQNNKPDALLFPQWPAPTNVKACTSTRHGGVSESPYQSLNLGMHVGDEAARVLENRKQLAAIAGYSHAPLWLNQVHGTHCVEFDNVELTGKSPLQADASFTRQSGLPCVVMTADCLPILICNESGNWVAACHAGWRGLLDGVVEKTVNAYKGNSHELMAWIGPAISQTYFEVGEEVKSAFVSVDKNAEVYFEANQRGRFQFDFIGLAFDRLKRLSVAVYGGELCTYADSEKFYSYRREGETGRMASLIWIEK